MVVEDYFTTMETFKMWTLHKIKEFHRDVLTRIGYHITKTSHSWSPLVLKE